MISRLFGRRTGAAGAAPIPPVETGLSWTGSVEAEEAPVPGLLSRKVTILILTWNAIDHTRRCLDSLRPNTPIGPNCRVLIVDNGSTDGTREYIESLDWVDRHYCDSNLGFVGGNNVGISLADPDSDVLLLNNDTIISQSDWLERIQRTAYQSDQIGIVGCRMLRANGSVLHAGTIMPIETFRGYQIGSNLKEVNQYAFTREVEGVSGACMYIKRSVLGAIGGLDKDFFSYYEDTDYCLKARQKGFRVMCAGDVTIVHVENVSTKTNKASFSPMYEKSRRTFMGKWKDELVRAEENRTPSVFWHSLVSFPTGYANSSKQIVLALDRAGVDVRLAYVYGSDYMEPPDEDARIGVLRRKPKDMSIPQVVYHQGDSFCKNSGKYRIGYTMLEVDGLPADWVTQSNHMDEIWVPSSFNVETFRSSGVTRPIHVIPLGVNPDYFNPRIKSFRPSNRFVFLSVFEWGERKNPESLLRAFTEEFSRADDVMLIAKVSNNDPGVHVQQQIADLKLRPDSAPVCLLYNQRIPDYQLGSLYRSADAFVLPTRGEGWCMPAMEAMACGLPTIVTDWSAQHDFISEETAYPLRVSKLIPARAKCPYYDGFRWAEPDYDHLRHQMRYVYEHRDEARQKGLRAAERVLTNWTWDKSAGLVMERLREIQ